jgi:hypothetical protein
MADAMRSPTARRELVRLGPTGWVELPSYDGGWHHHLELLEAQVAGGSRDWDWDRYRALKAEYEKLAAG